MGIVRFLSPQERRLSFDVQNRLDHVSLILKYEARTFLFQSIHLGCALLNQLQVLTRCDDPRFNYTLIIYGVADLLGVRVGVDLASFSQIYLNIS